MSTNTAKASDFTTNYKCLYNCLESISDQRYLYDVVLFNLHNSIEEELKKTGFNFESLNLKSEKRHKVIDLLLSDGELYSLVSSKNNLIKVYQNLLSDCEIKKANKIKPTIDSLLPDRSLINGELFFNILDIIQSDDYKYKVENSIARGLGVGINDVDYDPKDMSFKIRVSKNGKVLPNKQTIKKTKEKFKLKRLAGLKLTKKELDKENVFIQPAHYIYQGSVDILSQSSECQSARRGQSEESYCPKGLTTSIRSIEVETGLVKNISDSSRRLHLFYISSDIKGKTEDHTARGNISQINSTLKLIESSICLNRREFFSKGGKNSGFPFNLPCDEEVRFLFPAPIPKY